MPFRRPAAEIEASSREHGLAMKLYVVVTEPTPDGDLAANMAGHLAYQGKLEREGTLFGAGPLLTEDGLYGEGAGMIILRADSLDAARRIAEADPMHSSGARAFRLRPWLLNEGAVDVRVRLSDQTAQVR